MPKKRAVKKSTKKTQPKSFFIYRRYVIALSAIIIALGLFAFSKTPSYYFFATAKERVDFERSSGEYDQTRKTAIFSEKVIPVPGEPIHVAKKVTEETKVLGSKAVDKRIEVDLSRQRLYGVENGVRIYDFPISSGRPGSETPTGSFELWVKFRYVHLKGGTKALSTEYSLPNVPYAMFFYNDETPKERGFGIHGAYWYESFDKPQSFGNITMSEENVAQIYEWAEPQVSDSSAVYVDETTSGTEVLIYGTTPQS